MKPEYVTWIDVYVAAHGPHLRGWCADVTKEMVATFPELRAVRGWVTDKKHAHLYENEAGDFSSGHWWCVTPDGEVVDPTVSQFGNVVDLAYVPYDESRHGPMPVGKCPNCGWLIFPQDNAGGVHKECAAEFEAYMRRELGQ